jgi:sirohydrochlorin cobaltochelatase
MTATANSHSVPTSHPDEERGTILLAHGSHDPLWRQPIEAVAERLRYLAPKLHVCCAYLEVTAPDLPGSATEMAELGVRFITVVPLFLGLGKHARNDIPVLMAEMQKNHPNIVFTLRPTIGEEAQLIDLIAQIALS